MAVLAHFEGQTAPRERRRSQRRSLRLGAGAAGAAVVIHDISDTGMLIQSSAPMLVGASLEVELPHAGHVPATVVWTSGDFYGCEFDQRIPPAAVSAALLRSAPKERSAGAERAAVTVLRELSHQVEELASRLDDVLDKLGPK